MPSTPAGIPEPYPLLIRLPTDDINVSIRQVMANPTVNTANANGAEAGGQVMSSEKVLSGSSHVLASNTSPSALLVD